MLPIYEAVSLAKNTPLDGGSTRPLLVNVDTGYGLETFVVKIFKRRTLEQYNAVAFEVLTGVIANEFDLNTPEAALINFSNSFLGTLPTNIVELLEDRDERIKFGSKLVNAIPYTDALPYEYFKKFDIETIYAFDCMVFNGDRKIAKPNIIFDNLAAYLIDHEQTLLISEKRLDEAINGRLIIPNENHIFYGYLRRRQGKSVPDFETFNQYLSTFKPAILIEYEQQLADYGHGVTDFSLILDYFRGIKQNSYNFVKTVQSTLI